MTLEELKQKAEAATEGPWETYGPHIFRSGDGSANVASVGDPWKESIVGFTALDLKRRDACQQAWANRDYIAAMSPATVLKLLKMIELYKQAAPYAIATPAWNGVKAAEEIERSLG